jgi:RimJ/RimL family protein N-acetyltransferase
MQTARLFFRTWSPSDLPLAMALWGDARVTAFTGGPFTEKEVQERLAAEIERERMRGIQYWPMFLKEGSGHVGCCGLRPNDDARGLLEIGFYLRPEHWGKGFATEAARGVLAHAFDTVGARGVFAGHHPENRASKHAIAKLGLRYLYDELYPPTGLQHPSYLLTVEEYRRAPSHLPKSSAGG